MKIRHNADHTSGVWYALNSEQLVSLRTDSDPQGGCSKEDALSPGRPRMSAPHPALHGPPLQKNTVDPQPEMIVSTVNSVHFLNTVIRYVDRKTACRVFQAHLANAINFCNIKLSFPNCPYGHPGRRSKGQNERQLMALLCQ